jgi:outer membrane lipoprotein carrier protein
MLRFLTSAAVAVAALAFTAAPGLAAGLDDVIAALQAPFQAGAPAGRRIHDYRADFSQQSQIASLHRIQQAHGKVVVQFAGTAQAEPIVRFHWEYLEPSVQQIVSDGDRVWVYIPENNQVIVTETDQGSAPAENNPMIFLTGLGNLSRDFLIDWAEPSRDAENNYVLDLQPRRATPLLARLVIVVNQAAVDAASDAGRKLVFPIQSVTIYDTNGNSSMIAFTDVRINVGPDQSLFTFEIPPGVDIVRPEQGDLGF